MNNQRHSSWFWAQNFGNIGSACMPKPTKRFRNIDRRLISSFGTVLLSRSSFGSVQSLQYAWILWAILFQSDGHWYRKRYGKLAVQRLQPLEARFLNQHCLQLLALSTNMPHHQELVLICYLPTAFYPMDDVCMHVATLYMESMHLQK